MLVGNTGERAARLEEVLCWDGASGAGEFGMAEMFLKLLTGTVANDVFFPVGVGSRTTKDVDVVGVDGAAEVVQILEIIPREAVRVLANESARVIGLCWG